MELPFIVLLSIFLSACQSKTAKDKEWKELFDGKTLDGWRILNHGWGNPKSILGFYVINNVIICNTMLDNRGGAYLVTEGEYDNFT
jgi:hypothetical protein